MTFATSDLDLTLAKVMTLLDVKILPKFEDL